MCSCISTGLSSYYSQCRFERWGSEYKTGLRHISLIAFPFVDFTIYLTLAYRQCLFLHGPTAFPLLSVGWGTSLSPSQNLLKWFLKKDRPPLLYILRILILIFHALFNDRAHSAVTCNQSSCQFMESLSRKDQPTFYCLNNQCLGHTPNVAL